MIVMAIIIYTYISISSKPSCVLLPVDKCAKCDSHASCDNGKCKCNEGYIGDGETCTAQTGTGGSPGGKRSRRSDNPLYGRGPIGVRGLKQRTSGALPFNIGGARYC